MVLFGLRQARAKLIFWVFLFCPFEWVGIKMKDITGTEQ
jgi:hypothetical protein